MYTVGERTERVSAFSQPAPVEYVQTVDGRYVAVTPASQPGNYTNALRPVATTAAINPAVVERPVAVERTGPRRTVYRNTAAAQERVVVERAPAGHTRSWKKTALVIGGSSAAGAGVGGLIDGKKGALVGAALGGGAASIYEATKR